MSITATDENYCKHGNYVGGCGADHLCVWCENCADDQEFLAYVWNANVEDRYWEILGEAFTIVYDACPTFVNLYGRDSVNAWVQHLKREASDTARMETPWPTWNL